MHRRVWQCTTGSVGLEKGADANAQGGKYEGGKYGVALQASSGR